MPPVSYFSVSYIRIVLLIVVSLSVFFVELGTARLWDRDEPRNARASHEMLARGDWIVPTFNGELRDHKPILLYWGQMLSYMTVGESEFAARLPSALCALLTIWAVAFLGSRLAGKSRGLSQEGFWAAGCLATCGLFVMAGRAATPDACLVAFSTLGIAALVSSCLSANAPYSSGCVTRAKWLPAMFGYTMLGLAALAKGPVGLILPLAVVHLWWLVCNQLQQTDSKRAGAAPDVYVDANTDSSSVHSLGWEWVRQWVAALWSTFNPLQCWRAGTALRTVPGVLLSLLAAAPWYIAVGLETNGDFLRGFFLDHNLGRALGSMEGHNGSILFYPFAFLVGTFPWSMWVIPVALWSVKACRTNVVQRQMIALAAIWIAVYVIAFSAASTKLPSYITPCYVGAALALGGFWREFETAWSRPNWSMRRIAYGLTIAVGVGIAVAIVWLSRYENMPLLARAALAGGVVTLVGGLGFWLEWRQQVDRLPIGWLGAAAVFQIILFGFGTKSVDAYRGDLAALDVISQSDRSNAHEPSAWLAIGGMEPSWVHYLGCPIVEVKLSESDPAAWQQVAEFLKRNPMGRMIVVGEASYQKLVDYQNQSGQENVKLAGLREIIVAPRFLRPGNLRIFEKSREGTRQTALGISPAEIKR